MRSRTALSKITRQRIRRSVFRSIVDRQAAINAYLAEHNANPRPFVRTSPATRSVSNSAAYLYLLNPPNTSSV
jgi:hypothetical protein